MSLQKMDIESIVLGGGPVSSFVVLRTHPQDKTTTPVQLPIQIGNVEASAISMGIRPRASKRPLTHDLLRSVISALGGHCRSVRISSVEKTTFYAQLELENASGEQILLDARPSDAIALAVREHVPVLADDAVIATASLPDFQSVEQDEKHREMEEFHEFVETLSPEDFNVTSNHQDNE